eukprot:COSAG02_NODE_56_length_43700_cov_33.650765_24_plen_333_part_00
MSAAGCTLSTVPSLRGRSPQPSCLTHRPSSPRPSRPAAEHALSRRTQPSVRPHGLLSALPSCLSANVSQRYALSRETTLGLPRSASPPHLTAATSSPPHPSSRAPTGQHTQPAHSVRKAAAQHLGLCAAPSGPAGRTAKHGGHVPASQPQHPHKSRRSSRTAGRHSGDAAQTTLTLRDGWRRDKKAERKASRGGARSAACSVTGRARQRVGMGWSRRRMVGGLGALARGGKPTVDTPTHTHPHTHTHSQSANQPGCCTEQVPQARRGRRRRPPGAPTSPCRPIDHRLGWIPVEYVERTDKRSRLRGRPRDTGCFCAIVLIFVWFWKRLWIES